MSESHAWIKDGIKFVYLTGDSPYEIGFEHGRLLKKEIEELIKEIKRFAKENHGSFLTFIILNFFFLRSKSFKKRFPKNLIEEMKGVADGSGQNIKWVILANSIYEMAVPLTDFLKLNGCSFFAGSWKNSNYTIIGKTTDLMESKFLTDLLSKHRIVIIYDCKWTKSRYMTFSFPLCLTGDSVIFENGPVIAFNDGGWTEKKIDFKNIPLVPIIKEISNKSENIDKILENLKKYRTMKCYAGLLSDGTKKNSFLIELCKGDYHIKKFDKYLINTNHFKSEKMIKKHYREDYEKNIFYTSTLKRYQNIEEKMGSFSSLDDAMEIMEIHEDTFSIRNGSISNSRTVEAFVYFPKKKKLFIANGKKAPVTLTGEWIEFNLDEIFNHKKQS